MDVKIAKLAAIDQASGWAYGTLAVPPADKSRVPLGPAERARSVASPKDFVRQALSAFLSLRKGDDSAASNYLRGCGLFCATDVVSMNGHPAEVKAHWKSGTEGWRQPFATSLQELWRVHERLTAQLALGGVLQKRNDGGLERAIRGIVPKLAKLPEKQDPYEIGKCLLVSGVKIGLDGVHLGLLERNGRVLLALESTDLKSALYLAILSMLSDGTKLRQCKNRSCWNVFGAERGKKFCSQRCLTLDKVHRYRRKKRLATRSRQAAVDRA